MISAVIFDFDGTLADFVESDISALRYIHGLTGSDSIAEEFIDAAVHSIMQFHDMVASGKIIPSHIHHIRLAGAFEKMGIEWDSSFVDLYKSQLISKTRPYIGVIDLLSYLTDKVLLGLLTNASDSILQRKRIEASGLAGFFSEIVIAGEVGLSKPDPEIFRLMAERLGVLPEECLFVGDSVQYDITGAASAGMKTVLYGANRSVSKAADHEAEDISDLAILIKDLLTLQGKF